MKPVEELKTFVDMCHKLLRSDRDCIIGIGGFTGEGKSCFTTQFLMLYAFLSKTYWDFDRMSWSRKELLMWIDGKPKSKVLANGLREGQLPEYSGVLADELFSMFYRRTWYEEEQIDAIATFNMCRDRHLLLLGNIPNFWDLDTGFTSRIRFYIYIPNRGVAWVFEQENNPFATDKWNSLENKKKFRKRKNPYKLSNFVCELHFNDWTPRQKTKYYKIRNKKRLLALSENKSEKRERYGNVKQQRDDVIRMLINKNPKIKQKDISDVLGISQEAISMIYNKVR